MKQLYTLCILLLLCAQTNAQNGYLNYHRQTDLLMTSPGSLRFGLNGFENPALLSYIRSFDFAYSWTTQDRIGNATGDYSRWGAFAGFHNFGFGAHHENLGAEEITDYRVSQAFGDKSFSLGVGYGWSNGSRQTFNRASLWNIGMLIRPMEHLSIGVMGMQVVGGTGQQAVIDAGIRPFGNEWLTLFADYAISDRTHIGNGSWSAGAVVEPLHGLRFAGRYFDNKLATLGVQISVGTLGFSSHQHLDEDGNDLHRTMTFRVGDYDRNIQDQFWPKDEYVKLDMKGPVAYQRYKLFDKRHTLKELLEKIEAAKKDDGVRGIAINLSAIQANKEMIWELREKLKDFKASGKRVVAYIDRANIDVYHLASVSDKVVMDPQGMIVLEGYLLGRTYLKGTLEKVGLGFDEWRFFKYKSAMEGYSRESMSEADREQRQALVDDFYSLAKDDICSGRALTPETFDSYVNDFGIFMPSQALEQNLVDTLGRWDAVEAIVKKLENGSVSYTSGSMLKDFIEPFDATWGEEPRIAIVYALGACAMDEGIKARSLVKDVERVTQDSRIDAVVFRVDSPGGDGMASDIVAEALKKCSEIKPVIVSQGYVAASGGYWLSMYADTIVAAPNTITGSIGVIGGWVYNKELKQDLGMSTDHVKAGEHADLGFGFTFPLIGLTVPDRNLTPDEQAKMEHSIRAMYDDFVGKVAAGRNMDTSAIAEIAQGRVWLGTDGLKNGLVDELGGLWKAIEIAKERVGIAPGERFSLVEYPEPALLNVGGISPLPFGAALEDDPIIRHLKFRMDNNGIPILALPLEDWDATILGLEDLQP